MCIRDRKRIGQPFKHAEQLAEVQARADAIAAQLVQQERGPEAPQPAERPALVEEIRSDTWWNGRQASDVRRLLDEARSGRDSDRGAAAVYETLSAEIRRRYPDSVARHFGVERAAESLTEANPVWETGPIGPSSNDTSGPHLR